MAQSDKKAPAAQVKRIPQRMCVACRETDGKRELVRVVRSADGRVHIDLHGKAHGRGAYVCRNPVCWETALQRRALERALRIERLHPEDREALQAFGRALPPVAAPVAESSVH
jgi:predicted RNA-binding protein YlxR (DUF448 family)